MKSTLEGIWVGDSNLFRSITSRRYLFGLAASSEQPLRFVPALLQPSEVPGQMARSCLIYDVMPRDLQLSSAGKARFADAYGSLDSEVFEHVQNWFGRWVEKGVIEVRTPQNIKDLSLVRGTLRRYCHPNSDREIEPRDLQIISECVTVGAEYIATHNFNSIDHGELNDWAKYTKGLNRNLIGNASDLSAMLLQSVDDELEIIGAMASSQEPRSFNEETDSINRFITNLFRSHYNRLASDVQKRWNSMCPEQVVSFLYESRELSKTPKFVDAKLMNQELVDISNQARKLWQDMLDDMGFGDSIPS